MLWILCSIDSFVGRNGLRIVASKCLRQWKIGSWTFINILNFSTFLCGFACIFNPKIIFVFRFVCKTVILSFSVGGFWISRTLHITIFLPCFVVVWWTSNKLVPCQILFFFDTATAKETKRRASKNHWKNITSIQNKFLLKMFKNATKCDILSQIKIWD